MTPLGIKPANCLNQLRYGVPLYKWRILKILTALSLTTADQISVSGLFSLYPTSTGLISFRSFITNKILMKLHTQYFLFITESFVDYTVDSRNVCFPPQFHRMCDSVRHRLCRREPIEAMLSVSYSSK
jgi:hypothetical protein